MLGLKKHHRDQLRRQPFPAAWLSILEKNVPYYRCLSSADQEELRGHCQVFLDEKQFEGLEGLVLTDEILVTIAAHACVLLLHRESDYYPHLYSILVYPHPYRAPTVSRDALGIVTEGSQGRLGESWNQGTVVLAWDAVRAGAADVHDGHNVVFHEFAHQLDSEDDHRTDGVVQLPHRSMYRTWARILSHDYMQLREDVKAGRRTVLDRYGAENPAEFFAVATECFFEKAAKLRDKHPELYEELSLYYEQDPAAQTV